MSESNAVSWSIETGPAHPIHTPVELKLSLPAAIAPCIRMETVGVFTAVGLFPEEARALAAALIEFADRAEPVDLEDVDSTTDGAEWTESGGAWLATDHDPGTEVRAAGEGGFEITSTDDQAER